MRPVEAVCGAAELAASLQAALQLPSLEGMEEVGSQLEVCCTALGEVQDVKPQMAASWGLELAGCALSDGRGFLMQASSCCLGILYYKMSRAWVLRLALTDCHL